MKRFLALILCVLLLTSMVACGTEEQPALDVEGGSESEVKELKHLTYLTDQVSPVLDEQNSAIRGVLWWEVLDMTQSTLVWFDESGSCHPCLAEEYTLSDDGLTLVLKLRDDCYWTNGDLVVPEDVAFSINRVYSDEAVGSWMKPRWVPYLDRAEVSGTNEVTVYFNSPDPVLYTAMYFLWIIDESTYNSTSYDEYWALPPTCGAFKITAYDPVNNGFELSRNEAWWGWKEGSYFADTYGTGNVGTISIKYVPETTTRASSVLAEEVQAAENMTPETVAIFDGTNACVVNYERACHTMIDYRMAEGEIFADENLRKAVSLAIDRQAIADSIYASYADICKWPCGPMCDGYVEGKGYEYDPELAKQLIDASDYNGEELLFLCDVNTIPNGMEVSQAIQSMLQNVGLNIKISTPENSVYTTESKAGNYNLRFTGHVGANNDWFLDFTNLTYNDLFGTGWEDETLKGLLEDIMASGSDKQQETRAAAYTYMVDHFIPRAYLVNYPGLHVFSEQLDASTVILHSNSAVDYRFAVIND